MKLRSHLLIPALLFACGASAVGVGTALFYDPLVCAKINAGIVEYLQRHRLNHVSQLVGALKSMHDETDCCG